ncbi:regulator of chromosome condensation (RCC1)-like protein [Purpureocillium lavendulum]|uniref:Regulator of chromosome condensation (RCC1)-like protein n=1 Tax=Purpureocillium lavendulum TaxID=1247861 RepID=A0AB34FPD7_9HYPO|nr:regulator of chromosome condensation (RCC1)-like protein [Purpureocillium lavendulum]
MVVVVADRTASLAKVPCGEPGDGEEEEEEEPQQQQQDEEVTRPGMALFAAGFNPWNQLSLGRDTDSGRESDDLFSFAKVLEGRSIRSPVARLTYTLVRRDNAWVRAGVGLSDDYGDDALETSCACAKAGNGEILVVCDDGDGDDNPAGSGAFGGGVTQKSKVLAKYASRRAFDTQTRQASWRSKSPVKAVAAYDAGFVILYHDGTVATLGDARFQDCLGRETTRDSPSDEPGIVPDLADLGEPIKHVSAGGYTLVALTESGNIYAWGTPTSGTHRRGQALHGLGGIPNYVEVDGGKDVLDVALGDSHAIALTTDGSVYVVGNNSNGQLGLGREVELAHSWTKLSFPSGHEIAGVAAGPRSSFILTARLPP